MMELWFAASMLGLEANGVIAQRLLMLASAGDGCQAEALLMTTEKVGAALEATGTLMAGGSPAAVIARYREHVRLNAERLASL